MSAKRLDLRAGVEELRYAAQDHNHTYDEVDNSAATPGEVSAKKVYDISHRTGVGL